MAAALDAALLCAMMTGIDGLFVPTTRFVPTAHSIFRARSTARYPRLSASQAATLEVAASLTDPPSRAPAYPNAPRLRECFAFAIPTLGIYAAPMIM